LKAFYIREAGTKGQQSGVFCRIGFQEVGKTWNRGKWKRSMVHGSLKTKPLLSGGKSQIPLVAGAIVGHSLSSRHISVCLLAFLGFRQGLFF
jgi:hypothetical protein